MKTAVKRKIIKQKEKTFKGTLALIGRFLLVCIIAPFYYGWKFLKWLYKTFLTEVYEKGNNDVCGPGYYSWVRRKFSWGKLAFIVVIFFLIKIIIIYLIFIK